MNTKFDEYLEFPCNFSYKVMGLAEADLVEQVVSVVQQHAPGDYNPTTKPSSKGNYCSVSINVTVTSKAHIETLYRSLSAIDAVRHVL